MNIARNAANHWLLTFVLFFFFSVVSLESVAKGDLLYAPIKAAANIGIDQLEKKWKHAVDFGITTTKRNSQTLALFQKAIQGHLDDAATVVKGTYGWVKDSVVHFNPNTNIVVVLDKAGNFVSGWKLLPGTKQFENFIKNGLLQ